MRTIAAVSLVLLASVGAARGRIVGDTDMSTIVTTENVRTDGSTVSGELVNHSNDTLEDVRLLFVDTFLWRNEFRPGDDAPGRSAVFTVSTVPPRSRVPFHFARPPRPERDDGHFEPSVDVLSFTARPVQPLPPASSQAAPPVTAE